MKMESQRERRKERKETTDIGVSPVMMKTENPETTEKRDIKTEVGMIVKEDKKDIMTDIAIETDMAIEIDTVIETDTEIEKTGTETEEEIGNTGTDMVTMSKIGKEKTAEEKALTEILTETEPVKTGTGEKTAGTQRTKRTKRGEEINQQMKRIDIFMKRNHMKLIPMRTSETLREKKKRGIRTLKGKKKRVIKRGRETNRKS